MLVVLDRSVTFALLRVVRFVMIALMMLCSMNFVIDTKILDLLIYVTNLLFKAFSFGVLSA